MAYSAATIKEIIDHWSKEYNFAVAHGDAELRDFATAKIAFWRNKLKKED